MIIDNEVHLFIFCSNAYKGVALDSCIKSIEINVKTPIKSYNIVTKKKFSYKNYNVIEDREIWDLIDRELKFKSLYEYNWIKQQILKLSCDNIQKGNLLIVDADVFFLKPINFIENNKFNFYMALEYNPAYFYTNVYLSGIDKNVKESFISDFMIFNSHILRDIKSHIENYLNISWLDAITSRPNITNTNFNFSEYELYGNYMVKKYYHLINNLINPIDYKMWLNLYGEDMPENLSEVETDPEKFLEYVHSRSNNYYQSVWLHK